MGKQLPYIKVPSPVAYCCNCKASTSHVLEKVGVSTEKASHSAIMGKLQENTPGGKPGQVNIRS